jgi:DNA-binding NarL/FixJ family response regulator
MAFAEGDCQTQRVRVLIADASPAVRSALELTLSGASHTELVGAVADGPALIHQCASLQPDVVLLDLLIPGVDPQSIRAAHPGVHIVALSSHRSDRVAALRAGADAFVCKGDHPERLHAILRLLADYP